MNPSTLEEAKKILLREKYLSGHFNTEFDVIRAWDLRARSFTLWKEGYLCRERDRHNAELVNRRWVLRETQTQLTPRQVKEKTKEINIVAER